MFLLLTIAVSIIENLKKWNQIMVDETPEEAIRRIRKISRYMTYIFAVCTIPLGGIVLTFHPPFWAAIELSLVSLMSIVLSLFSHLGIPAILDLIEDAHRNRPDSRH